MLNSAISFILILLSSYAIGQTCCSGGVPVSSNIGFRGTDSRVFHLGLVAEYNSLATLKTGSQKLNDDLRKRTTNSFIIRGAYSVSPRFSVEAFIPFVIQNRDIRSARGGSDFERSSGIGDPIILGLYQILFDPISLRIGAGPQLPLGSYSETNSRGLLLLEDLQPGSGALDAVIMVMAEKTLGFRPTSSIFLNYIQSINGSNPNARRGLQTYRFGNDSQFILGYGDQVLLFNQIFNVGTSFRYRHVNSDTIDNQLLPGTGGDFIFVRINSGINIGVNSAIGVNLEWPLYSVVTDTQLAPTFSANLSFSKKFQLKNKL